MSQVAIVIDVPEATPALLGTQLATAKEALRLVVKDLPTASATLANELPTTHTTGNDTYYGQTSRKAEVSPASITQVLVSAADITLNPVASDFSTVEVAGANTTTATATGVVLATSVLVQCGGIKDADQTYTDLTSHVTITADDTVTFDNDASAYHCVLTWYDPA